MVSTRTQDGTIPTKSYSPTTTRFRDLSVSNPPTSPTTSHHRGGPRSPTKITKPFSSAKARKKALLHSPLTPAMRAFNADNRDEFSSNARVPPIPPSIRKQRGPLHQGTVGQGQESQGKGKGKEKETTNEVNTYVPIPGTNINTFWPSVIIGAKEETGLSKIGRADKEVEQMKQILEEYEEHEPQLAPAIKQRLEESKRRRAALDETLPENWRVGDIDPAKTAIEKRLETLERGLSTAEFEPEANNIRCAIDGYKNGLIGYEKHFTIIYDGKIVDTVPDYASMVRNRNERLDRYFEAHGHGWLWWEPPLAVRPEEIPRLCLSVGLNQDVDLFNSGGWEVNEGFWKQHGWVARLPDSAVLKKTKEEEELDYIPAPDGTWDCQAEGPKFSFRMIADTGATWPALHTADLKLLGIHLTSYGAQSLSSFQTAQGEYESRIYEMFCAVLDNNGRQLVDPNDPLNPNKPYLGTLTPVVHAKTEPHLNENGIEVHARLSGRVPFLACYVSMTPDRPFMYLGEDRNDVLGLDKMPGQKHWDVHVPRDDSESLLELDRYGTPKVLFSHLEGDLVDEDCVDSTFVSRVITNKRTPELRKEYYRDPRDKRYYKFLTDS